MKSRIADKDVLQLLTGLKNSNNNYPKDLIESRREIFTKQAAAMALLMKAGTHGANGAGASQTASTAPTTPSSTGISGISMGTLLETLLMAALVVEAGVAAYVYREKIAEFFTSTFGPKVEQVSSPINNSSDIITSYETTAVETLDETPTATVTPPSPGYTPTPAVDNNDGSESAGNTQVESTPDPNDNPGNRYGNTPKAERTKEKNDNDKSEKDKSDKNR